MWTWSAAETVQIDIFTLFPQWFEWFRSQRHVRNALAGGSSVECVDIRAHTPLAMKCVMPCATARSVLLRKRDVIALSAADVEEAAYAHQKRP